MLVSGAAGGTASDVPFFEGLGSHSRGITTGSAEAQRYFDQGLAFLYAFNHDEAIRSFRRAGELDPKCAMAFWGVAVANGPHINNPVVPADRAKAAWEALARAKALAPGASPVERALIEALASRYAWPQPVAKLFLETEYLPAPPALLCRRRPRARHEKPIWALHVLAGSGTSWSRTSGSTGRARR